jgi:hypothetical protein
MLVKETERILQEEAVDCPLLHSGNVFPEELEKYKNCGTADNPCPAICGYMKCDFKCGDALLNAQYYDSESNIYRKVEKSEIDYSTYDIYLASEEINYATNEIIKMYATNYVYQLDDIVQHVKNSMSLYKQEMFDDYYVYQALDRLIPITKNDFNNFKDIIYDKRDRMGYLIFRESYYIFQPFDENENVSMYYRKNKSFKISGNVSLQEYVQNAPGLFDIISKNVVHQETYDFYSRQEYYDEKKENIYVGIIDKKTANATSDGNNDSFKIRKKMPSVIVQRRKAGLPTFKGAVCKNAKDHNSILRIMEKIGIPSNKKETRDKLCERIRGRLYDMEKYSTTKDGNKMTYLIIPSNHPTIPFPLNLEDRIKEIITSIKKVSHVPVNYKINIKKVKGVHPDISYVEYTIIFDKELNKISDILETHGAVKKENVYLIEIM